MPRTCLQYLRISPPPAAAAIASPSSRCSLRLAANKLRHTKQTNKNRISRFLLALSPSPSTENKARPLRYLAHHHVSTSTSTSSGAGAMATAPNASSLFLVSSPISTAPRARAGSFPPSAQPTLRLRPRLSPAVAAAVQAEHQPALAATPKPPALPFRVGHGFDLHRLEPNLPLIIGGINIPHDRGCEAHSDGDVLLHCVVDAILGALGLPDIGQIFPDSDPRWKGADSSVFMREAVKLMHEAGYELGNLDATLILQKPKLSPFKETIRSNLCDLLGADPSVVNLKAKTHEKVDSLGENRSIAAHTVVLLMRK